MEQIKMGINSISSSSLFNNPQMIENSVSRPEGFQGSSKDVFVHDDNRDFANEQAFASAGRLFKSHASAQAQKAEGPITVQGDGVNMYRNRAGYDSSFLGKELPLPELGSSIKDKVAMRTDKPGEYVLPSTPFPISMVLLTKTCPAAANGNSMVVFPANASWATKLTGTMISIRATWCAA